MLQHPYSNQLVDMASFTECYL